MAVYREQIETENIHLRKLCLVHQNGGLEEIDGLLSAEE
jgi:hypothetical protein